MSFVARGLLVFHILSKFSVKLTIGKAHNLLHYKYGKMSRKIINHRSIECYNLLHFDAKGDNLQF